MLEEKTCELLCKKTLTKAEKDVKSEVFGLTSSKFPRFSPFRAHVRKVLARFKGFRRQDRFRNMIADEYLVNWIVDNLPAITRYRQTGAIIGVFDAFWSRLSLIRGSDDKFTNGILVGLSQGGKYYLHNHVSLELHFHSNPEKYSGYRIVGFEALPRDLRACLGQVEPRSSTPRS